MTSLQKKWGGDYIFLDHYTESAERLIHAFKAMACILKVILVYAQDQSSTQESIGGFRDALPSYLRKWDKELILFKSLWELNEPQRTAKMTKLDDAWESAHNYKVQ